MYRDYEKPLPWETEEEARESAVRALKRADEQLSDEAITRFADERRQMISENGIDSHLQRIIEPTFDRR